MIERIETAGANELPAIIGELEALKARAWARMTGFAAQPPKREGKLTMVAVAERIGKSKDWLYDHVDELPFLWREGREVKISAAALEAYLAQKGKGD